MFIDDSKIRKIYNSAKLLEQPITTCKTSIELTFIQQRSKNFYNKCQKVLLIFTY